MITESFFVEDHESKIKRLESELAEERGRRRLIKIGLGEVSIANARHADDQDGPERMVVIRELNQLIPVGEDAGDGDMIVSEDDKGVLAMISIEKPENSHVLMECLVLAIEAANGQGFDDPDHAFQSAYVRAIKVNAALKAELAEAKKQILTWISTGDELPPNQTPVFVRVKSPHDSSIWHVTAEHIEGMSIRADTFCWDDADVCDVNSDGVEFVPEGWYEIRPEFGDVLRFSWPVVAWANIPGAAEQ